MQSLRLSHRLFGSLAVLSTLTLAACNVLTGADSLEIVGVDEAWGEGGNTSEGPGGPGGPDGPGGGPGGPGGFGGEDGQGGSGNTGHGGSGNEGGSAGRGGFGGQAGSDGQAGFGGETGGETTSSMTTSTTTTTGPTDCVYPSGPTGVTPGNLVRGDLSWQGYADGQAQSGTINIKDYHDCDGTRGINAILIINSATWCGVCQEEATDLPSHASSFKSQGIRVLTLMVENASGQPASLNTATSWRNNFGLDDFTTCADPGFTFAGSGSVGLPLQIIVDPRTMKIVDRIEGFAGYSAVTQLASQNKN